MGKGIAWSNSVCQLSTTRVFTFLIINYCILTIGCVGDGYNESLLILMQAATTLINYVQAKCENHSRIASVVWCWSIFILISSIRLVLLLCNSRGKLKRLTLNELPYLEREVISSSLLTVQYTLCIYQRSRLCQEKITPHLVFLFICIIEYSLSLSSCAGIFRVNVSSFVLDPWRTDQYILVTLINMQVFVTKDLPFT